MIKSHLQSERGLAPIAVSRYGLTGASTRVRLTDWFAHVGLQAERWDYLGAADNQIGTLLPRLGKVAREELRLRIARSGLDSRTLIMSRGASPFSSGSLEESLLRRANFSVYDFDDAINVGSPSLLRRIWSEKKVWARSVEAADVVIAGSDVLAESAAAIRDDVVMIPSCVEPGLYNRKQDYEVRGCPVAVWIGTPSTERFLLGIADELLSLNRRWGLRVRVVSAGNASLGALDRVVDRIQWTADTFQHHLGSADIGIMPLPDTPFERGKCAYKLLQYGAAGLPTVGSPVGANILALERLGGIAAGSSSHAWEDAISSLIAATAGERALMGATACEGVENHYSYASWADVWLRAMQLGDEVAASNYKQD